MQIIPKGFRHIPVMYCTGLVRDVQEQIFMFEHFLVFSRSLKRLTNGTSRHKNRILSSDFRHPVSCNPDNSRHQVLTGIKDYIILTPKAITTLSLMSFFAFLVPLQKR